MYCQTRPRSRRGGPRGSSRSRRARPGGRPRRGALGRGRPLGLGRCRVAGDERQAADPPGQAVAAQDPPDAVGADDDAAPALLGERGADPPRPEARMAEGEGDDPLLELARLVGHPGRPALAGPEHLEPPGRPVPTGSRWTGGSRRSGTPPGRCRARLRGEHSKTEPMDDIIGGQAAPPSVTTGRSKRRMRRLSLWVWELPAMCREISESVHPRVSE